MAEKLNPVARVAEVARDGMTKGSLYSAEFGRLGPLLQLNKLGCNYMVVPVGKSACPHHAHHAADEIFVILEGNGTYRFGEERYEVQPGDVLGAPAGGADYAHQIINTGTEPLKYLAISTQPEFDTVDYPDSGKTGYYGTHASTGDFMRHLARDGEGRDYWDGEEGAQE